MKDQKTRDMMGELYRLIEKYEETPVSKYTDDAEKWFGNASIDCLDLLGRYKGNEFAESLAVGFYTALENRFKAVNKLPLINREEEPEQLSF